jgi:hypothetical protein
MRESAGRLNHKTVLHVASETNNLPALRALLERPEINPFLRHGGRKTARQEAVTEEARRLLWAYEQWKPIRECQHWWGPVFMERSFALMRAIRYLSVPVYPDIRRYLMVFLAECHAV